MTDIVVVALIGGSFSFLAALLSFAQYVLGIKTNRKINVLEVNTNGKMNQLLEARVEAAFQRGLKEAALRVEALRVEAVLVAKEKLDG